MGERGPFDRYWRIRTNLPERFGQPCRVLARGKMNSCRIEFEDGVQHIVSRNSIRKLALATPPSPSPDMGKDMIDGK